MSTTRLPHPHTFSHIIFLKTTLNRETSKFVRFNSLLELGYAAFIILSQQQCEEKVTIKITANFWVTYVSKLNCFKLLALFDM